VNYFVHSVSTFKPLVTRKSRRQFSHRTSRVVGTHESAQEDKSFNRCLKADDRFACQNHEEISRGSEQANQEGQRVRWAPEGSACARLVVRSIGLYSMTVDADAGSKRYTRFNEP